MHGIVDVRKATESALWRQAGSLPEGQATELDMGTPLQKVLPERIGDCPPCTGCKTLSSESCAAG